MVFHAGRRTKSGNARARAEMPPVAVVRSVPRPTRGGRKSVNLTLLPRTPATEGEEIDPEWVALEKQGHDYAAARIAELQDQLGYLSISAALLIQYEAEAAADAAWVRALAQRKSSPELLKLAHTLRQIGKNTALTAFELAVREAVLASQERPEDPRAVLEAQLDEGIAPAAEETADAE